MANKVRIKRRAAGGAAGAPASLENAELAFNEQDKTLYYGEGTGGVGGSATQIIPIGGTGAFVDKTTAQTVDGIKTFTASPVAPTPAPGSNNTQLATTAFVQTAANAAAVSDGDKGDITVAAGVWNIDPNTVSNAKLADMPVSTFKGRATAGTGDPEDLTVAQAKSLLNLAGTNSGDQTITLTGDVTGSGTGSFATAIAANSVSNAKLATMPTATFKGNNTAGTANPVDLTVAQTKSMLALDQVNNTTDANKPVSSAQQTAINARIASTEKGAANGVAPLGADSKIAAVYLPSYVDDVLEYANFAGLPVTGETGKMYITLDNNKTFRWGGTAYAEISASPGSSDAVPEGSVNLYFTDARARTAVIVQTVTNGDTTHSPSSDVVFDQLALKAPTANPTFTGTVSGVTKSHVGLANVDNTSDTAKPVSTAQATAIGLKADTASPALTGVPTAPTPAVGTNTTQLATTAHVQANMALALLKSQNLADLPNAATARTNMGLGSMATQNANAVNITGGSIDNITIDGGTF